MADPPQSTGKTTTEVQMLALAAAKMQVLAQEQVCNERFKRLRERVLSAGQRFTAKTDSVDQRIEAVEEKVEKLSAEQSEQFVSLTVAVTRNNTKWTFFQVVSGIIAALGALSGIAALLSR